jgi:hypothetical protein
MDDLARSSPLGVRCSVELLPDGLTCFAIGRPRGTGEADAAKEGSCKA